MKTILIALALTGFTLSSAEAQTKTVTTTTTTKTCTCNKAAKKVAVLKPAVRVNKKPAVAATKTRTYQVCEEKNGFYTCCPKKQVVVAK